MTFARHIRRALVVLAVCLLAAPASTLLAQSLSSPPAWEPETGPAPVSEPDAPADEPSSIAQRLFAALLDREPSALELEQAARQIDAGQLDALIGTLLGSSEYRRFRATKSSRSLLEHFYQALFDRAPDSSAFASYGPQLDRGDDTAVVRALLASDEFDEVIAGEGLAANAVEQACMAAVEKRVTRDRRQSAIRFLTIETTSASFITSEIRGTARLEDGALIDFACTAERLRGSIVEVDYRQIDEAMRSARIVRCESIDARRRECPADTGGGVALVRQLSRTICQRNVNWGFTAEKIWVDQGCRAEFRVLEATAEEPQTLKLSSAGWGFFRQAGSQPVWFDAAELSCSSDGGAELSFEGENAIVLSGTCYRSDETRFELALSAAPGAWYASGGATVTVVDDALLAATVAGRSRFGQAFSIDFSADRKATEPATTHGGSGALELADGRRAAISGVGFEPAGDGRVTLVFDGQTRLTFAGSWFRTWSGSYEMVLDGGLDDTSLRGAGEISFSELGRPVVRLTGTAPSLGGAFRLVFEGN